MQTSVREKRTVARPLHQASARSNPHGRNLAKNAPARRQSRTTVSRGLRGTSLEHRALLLTPQASAAQHERLLHDNHDLFFPFLAVQFRVVEEQVDPKLLDDSAENNSAWPGGSLTSKPT